SISRSFYPGVTDSDFDVIANGFTRLRIKEKDTAWFVKFCVPRCKHCKNLGTLWDDLEKAIEGTDEIEIGEVDC
ncbi:hypothetical protein HN51_032673, partial [Arachis hypogaea]